MGLDLKSLSLGLLVFCSWGPLTQGSAPEPCARISSCGIQGMAETSMTDSNILVELADAATKNQGGSKAIKGIKGLKVKDIRPPNITVTIVKNVGLCMEVISQITIAGKSFIGGTMEITVKSNMTTISKFILEGEKVILVVLKCIVELISCKTNLPSSMLPKIVNKFLNSTLSKVMPNMMCPAANKVVSAMEKKIEFFFAPQAIGSLAQIKYALSGPPKTTKDHIIVCFKSQLTKVSGEEIKVPTEPPALPEQPELDDQKSELTLPVNHMNSAMELHKSMVDQDVTSKTEEAGSLINRDALKKSAPTMEISETYGELKFKIRGTSTPTWFLGEGVAILTVPLSVELVAGPQEESLILLTLELKISATFKVIDGQLHTSLGNSSLENLQKTSTVLEAFEPESLSSYLLDLLHVTVVVALQKAIEVLLPLPSLMGASYGEAEIEIYQNTLRAVVTSVCK